MIFKALISFFKTFVREHTCYYALQEDFVADQLFQSPENSSDELLLIAHSIFSSAKVQLF